MQLLSQKWNIPLLVIFFIALGGMTVSSNLFWINDIVNTPQFTLQFKDLVPVFLQEIRASGNMRAYYNAWFILDCIWATATVLLILQYITGKTKSRGSSVVPVLAAILGLGGLLFDFTENIQYVFYTPSQGIRSAKVFFYGAFLMMAVSVFYQHSLLGIKDFGKDSGCSFGPDFCPC